MTSPRPSLTICICTSGRPAELRRCLASIAAGSRQPHSVLVSDDSGDTATADAVRSVCAGSTEVTYLPGPRRGISANRNSVIRFAETTHVSLVDDDAVIGADFVERALDAIRLNPTAILSGTVIEGGEFFTAPNNLRFLGHFGRPVRPGEALQTLQLNSNVFPRAVFTLASFDEAIVYGYEDADLCSNLLSKGATIIHSPALVNLHIPPAASAADDRQWRAERARFYTSVRRYGRWEKRPLHLVLFCLLAPLHFTLYALKRRRWTYALRSWLWIWRDLRALSRPPIPQVRAP